MKRKQIIDRRGFTIIELVVSLAVFVIIVSIAVGGFVSALRSQRQVAALISVNNNASLAIEEMAREIRTGRNFSYSTPGSPDGELTFYNAEGALITYRKNFAGKYIERGITANLMRTFQRLTSEGVLVHYLTFSLFGDFGSGTDSNDEWPTRVTIMMGVGTQEPGVSEGIVHLQTTVSSRQKDEP